jgi:hypothetical protein
MYAADPLAIDDLKLLLQLKVAPATIADLAKTRCLVAPLNSSSAADLVKLGATTELIGLLAGTQCNKAPKNPEIAIEKCPQAYQSDPAGKGCIDLRRGASYLAQPPEHIGRCVIDVMVDGITTLVLRGTLLLYEVESGAAPADVNSTCSQPFPAKEIRPSMATERGRGTALMTVQPAAGNQYSLRIRVQDDQKGRDHYRLVVDWMNP